MKQLRIILIVLLSVVTVGLIGIIIFFTTSSHNSFFRGYISGSCELINEQEIDLSKVNTIEISFSSEDIIFYEGDSDKLVLKEYRTNDRADNENAQINIDEKSKILSIIKGRTTQKYNTFINFGNSWSYVEVYLPKECQKNLIVGTSSGDIKAESLLTAEKSIAIESSSGDISLEGVTALDISVDTQSGDINIENANGNRNIHASSGDVRVLGGDGGGVVKTSSGDIIIENTKGNFEIGASSGDVYVTGSSCGGSIKTTSGDIVLELEALTKDLNLESSSGDCQLLISKDTSFVFQTNTSSGDIRTFFDENLSYNKKGNVASGSYGTNTIHTISMETSSGDVTVLSK